MDLTKQELAKSNNSTHLILIVEVQTYTQKKTSDPRPFFRAPTCGLKKTKCGQKQQLYTFILLVEAQIDTQKTGLGSEASSLSSYLWS